MVTPRQLRESASTLARHSTHELPVMVSFCARLRWELLEAANRIEELEHQLAQIAENTAQIDK